MTVRVPVSGEDFIRGAFASRLPELFALGRLDREGPNGAEQAAPFLFNLMKSTGLSDES